MNASVARGDMLNAPIARTGIKTHRRMAVREDSRPLLAANHRKIGPVAIKVKTGDREPVVNIAPTTRTNASIGLILFLIRQPRAVLYPIARKQTKLRND